MSLVLIVYLIGVLPSISVALATIGFITAILLSIIGIIWFCCSLDEYKNNETRQAYVKPYKLCFKLIPVSLFLVLITSIVPSEKTMYYMVAAYGTEKLIENPIAKDLAGVDVLKQLLAKAKKELQEPETPTKKDVK
jgi:uncharacterized membrane protein YiaA